MKYEFFPAPQIQVAHFEPDEIVLTGEGVFPRISFNLPREMTEVGCTKFASLRQKALDALGKMRGTELKPIAESSTTEVRRLHSIFSYSNEYTMYLTW